MSHTGAERSSPTTQAAVRGDSARAAPVRPRPQHDPERNQSGHGDGKGQPAVTIRKRKIAGGDERQSAAAAGSRPLQRPPEPGQPGEAVQADAPVPRPPEYDPAVDGGDQRGEHGQFRAESAAAGEAEGPRGQDGEMDQGQAGGGQRQRQAEVEDDQNAEFQRGGEDAGGKFARQRAAAPVAAA